MFFILQNYLLNLFYFFVKCGIYLLSFSFLLQVTVAVRDKGALLTWDFDVLKGKCDFTLYLIPDRFLPPLEGMLFLLEFVVYIFLVSKSVL
jgi:hypothetical protein